MALPTTVVDRQLAGELSKSGSVRGLKFHGLVFAVWPRFGIRGL